MVRKCGVEGCLSDSNRPEDIGVTFHKVPMHSDIRPKWLSLCRVSEEKKTTKVIYVCSRHFLRADFCSFKGTKYMLRQGVLPSVFPWDKSKLEALKAEIKKEVLTGTEIKSPDTEMAVKEESKDNVDIKEETKDADEVNIKQEISDLSVEDIKLENDISLQPTMIKQELKLTETNYSKINFAIDSQIEALDFNNTWYPVKIAEVDYEENEVLIHFENDSTKYDEWICMDSPRLRPSQESVQLEKTAESSKEGQEAENRDITQIEANKVPSVIEQYIVGERCLACWSCARRFPATVTKVLGSDSYEVLFDDGFVKNLKAHLMFKADAKHVQSSPLFAPIQSTKEERREKKRKLNVAELFGKRPRLSDPSEKPTETPPVKPEGRSHVRTSSQKTKTSQKGHSRSHHKAHWKSAPKPTATPSDVVQSVSLPSVGDAASVASPKSQEVDTSSWIPEWVNDEPVGIESTIDAHDGTRRSVIVPDPRIPEGWAKHLTRRLTGVSAGKWDTIIVSPDNKRFRSRGDIKSYLEANPHFNINIDAFDFSIYRHMHRHLDRQVQRQRHRKPVVGATQSERQKASRRKPALSANQLDTQKPPHRKPVVAADQLETDKASPVAPETSLVPEDNVSQELEHLESTEQESDKDTPNLKILHVDHAYKCPIEGCGKNFRRENLAQMHVKHYHPEYTKFLDSTPNVADLAYARTVGDSLDRSPGPTKTPPSRQMPKTATSKTPAAKLPQTPMLESDIQPLSPQAQQPAKAVKDTEIIKLLKSKLFETTGDLENVQEVTPARVSTPSPPALPSNHTDIKLRDLLNKSEGLPKMEDRERVLKNLSGTRPSGIKTLLPVRQPVEADLLQDTEAQKKSITEALRKSLSGKSGTKHGLKRKKPGEHIVEPPIVEKEPTLIPEIIPPQEEPPVLAPEPPTHIIEGGKIIKIVRMKQEEIINCTCGFAEEDGLMIQCELCLCWQHAYCNNIEQESQVPEKYVCYICQNPARQRPSRKYFHDQDWLKQGVLPTASYHAKDQEVLQKRFDKLKKAHDVSGALVELKEFVHGLRVKLKIAEAKNHPKLYLWSKQWEKIPLPEKMEEEEKDVKQCEDKSENDISGDNNQQSDSQNDSMLMMILKGSKEDSKLDLNSLMDTNQSQAPIIPQPEAAIDSAVCRFNLLEHISHSQNLVMERLDDFEQRVAALEEGLTIEESEDYPKTRQTVQMLLKDLNKLQEFSALSSI